MPPTFLATALLAGSVLALPPSPPPPTPARAEVWIGGSRAWPDLISERGRDEWRFLQANVDGFYINNFAMRHKGEDQAASKQRDLEAIRDLITHKDVFYETDRIHDSDAFDRESLALFRAAKLRWVASTINYGTDSTRNNTLTDSGHIPLYYMFGPWRGGGDIALPQNDALRTNILSASGGAVDGPVTMWRKNAGGMNPMCYATIRWCHANSKKFLYLLAPNESGKDFLAEAQKLAHDMEDNDANPDIWAVSFYGPQSFRDKLETLPECDADGRPAATFCGAAYWLLHHLRDPDHSAKLIVPTGSPVFESHGNQKHSSASYTYKASHIILPVGIQNRSTWLDLAPRIHIHPNSAASTPGWTIRCYRGTEDVTSAAFENGLAFTRTHRLEPGATETLRIEMNWSSASSTQPTQPPILQIELFSHPSETKAEETLFFVPTSLK